VGQYIAFYAVHDGEVVILRVLHGRRDIIAEGVGG
jgi:plasmid stabilization system protein ParE